MKKIIGLFAVLLTVLFITIIILRIWGIHIISVENFIRSSTTLIVLGVAIIILLILYGSFFKSNSGYDDKIGNNAHPKK